MNYGNQIKKLGVLDVFTRSKNRVITRYQYRILNGFAKIPFRSGKSMLFARVARKLVGGYIYSIKLEVNDYCNLKCKMCYVDMKQTDLEKEVIFSLFDQIRGFGIRLEILGGGTLDAQGYM